MLVRASILVVAWTIAISSAVAEEKIDYEKQIQPIFVEHCGKCHGESMAAGKMRLHTAAALQEKWDADKELIVPGEPEKSELYERLVLPEDNPKRMPKKADPLTKDTIELIAAWIRQGAVLGEVAKPQAEEAKADEAQDSAAAPAEELPLPEVEAAPREAIEALAATGAQVMPLYAGTNLLQVSFAHRGEPAGDAELALLAPLAEQVYMLNLADAKASEAGFAPLAGLKNLSVLHLERSAATDNALAHVAGLSRLSYLNLYGTGITDAGLAHLTGLRHLRRLYLWQTKVSYDAAMGMEKDLPGLIVNLGYNHPVVMKNRLTKELEAAKAQAEEAKTELTKAEQQLESAKKNSEAVNARVAEVEKQLKELEAPAEGDKPQAGEAPAETSQASAENS